MESFGPHHQVKFQSYTGSVTAMKISANLVTASGSGSPRTPPFLLSFPDYPLLLIDLKSCSLLSQVSPSTESTLSPFYFLFITLILFYLILHGVIELLPEKSPSLEVRRYFTEFHDIANPNASDTC